MKRLTKEFISLAKILIVSYIVVTLLVSFVIRPVIVRGSSMEPTLHNEDIGFSYIITKKLFGLKRGSIVTVYVEDEKQYLAKRVIGLPGETIHAVDGVVYINDIPLDEPYLDTEFKTEYENRMQRSFMQDFPKKKIPEGMYFVMGDNRPNSKDSREYGPFLDKDIDSNSLFILYPFDSFGIK